jgi:hypothetical protein
MNALTYLTSETFSNIPADLVVDLQRMLSIDAASRPSAMAFTGVYHLPFPHSRQYIVEFFGMRLVDQIVAVTNNFRKFFKITSLFSVC